MQQNSRKHDFRGISWGGGCMTGGALIEYLEVLGSGLGWLWCKGCPQPTFGQGIGNARAPVSALPPKIREIALWSSTN